MGVISDWLGKFIDAVAGRPVIPFPGPPRPPAPPAPYSLGGIALDLIQAHNERRKASGKPYFLLSDRLSRAAQAHAEWMAMRGMEGHRGIGDGDPWDRIQATGYHYLKAGENVAGGQRSIDDVVGAWMDSPGHRANILGAYAEFGGGMARDKNGVAYWCTTFATPDNIAAGAPSGLDDLVHPSANFWMGGSH